MFCTTAASWPSGSANCNTYGYELLTINDASENSWADSTADTYSTQKWWIGLNDRASEGSFRWASGESVGYELAPGGAEQLRRQRGLHAVQPVPPSQTWNDEPCNAAFRAVCEELVAPGPDAQGPPSGSAPRSAEGIVGVVALAEGLSASGVLVDGNDDNPFRDILLGNVETSPSVVDRPVHHLRSDRVQRVQRLQSR